MTAPRFDIRFSRAEQLLVLRTPFTGTTATIEAMEMRVGQPSTSVTLEQGAGGFRNRRSSLKSLTVRIPHQRLLATVRELGIRLHIDAGVDGAIWCSVVDSIGVIGFRVTPHMQASSDLALCIDQLRGVTDAPTNLFRRLYVALLPLGLPQDAQHAGVLLPRAARHALADALMSHGWRVPDDRGVLFSCWTDGTAFWMREDPQGDAPSLSERRVSPAVFHALSDGDVESALGESVSEEERWIIEQEQRCDERVFPSDARDPQVNVLQLRHALRQQDYDAAVACLPSLSSEPSDLVRADAMSQVAQLASARGQDPVPYLLESIKASPRTAIRFVGWLERSGLKNRIELVNALATAVSSARLPRTTRARFLGLAASVLSSESHHKEASEWLAQAKRLAPESASVMCAEAELLARDGHLRSAQDCWDRALNRLPPSEHASARARFARVLILLGHYEAATEQLRHALAEPSSEVIATLAQLQIAKKEPESAAKTLGRLLTLDAPSSKSLAFACRFHRSVGAMGEAAMFFERLEHRKDWLAVEFVNEIQQKK